MNLKNGKLHHLIPKNQNSCTESHIILVPPYVENGKEYSVFKIFQNTGKAIYVTDDIDCGITLKLEAVHTEIDELLPLFDYQPENPREFCDIKIYKVMKYLPTIVSLERIVKFPNEILFKNYTDFNSEECLHVT